VTVLSVDLASRRYRDNGLAILRDVRSAGTSARGVGEVHVELLSPAALGLADPPQPAAFARVLNAVAEDVGARVMLLDGPQGWRAGRSALVHQRQCERDTRAPGKTGLPGIVKPATWTRMAEFSVALFDALDSLGWPRLDARWSGGRAAIESFPTQAWRSLGLAALPSRAKTPSLEPWRQQLLQVGRCEIPEAATHDELQAIVAGLAGVQLLRDGFGAVDARGCDPQHEAGHWREGWIVSPRV
jgi:hypothetical protein